MIPLNVSQNVEVGQYMEEEQPLSFVTPIPKNNVLYIQFCILHSFTLGVKIKSRNLPPDWCVPITVIVFEMVCLIFFLVGYRWCTRSLFAYVHGCLDLPFFCFYFIVL